MREFKFRAWDKKRRSWFEGFYINSLGESFSISSARGLWQVFDSEDGGKSDDYDLELSQFTGLHDKNGKEIYEGDVVVIDGGLKWICKWSDNHARFYFDTGLHKTYDFSSQESGDFEVIGNIYENPELVGVKDE